jgi:60 kDa SS-A/Ro ribonucleoprotein
MPLNSTSSRPFDGMTELSISPRQRLDDVVRAVGSLPAGGTDIALPMLWAQARREVYDAIIVYTDNESWAGSIHPHQALKRYRDWAGVNTRLIVAAMTATEYSVADPADPAQLDVVGFDQQVPNLIADFTRGALDGVAA